MWLSNQTLKGDFIMQFFKKRPKRLTKAEINCLYEHYRNMILNNKAVELITKEDYRNLIAVAKYSKLLGSSTAIQAAFCLGYKAGKGGAKNEQE